MVQWSDVVDEQGLGTATALTTLAGAHNNAAGNYLIPFPARGGGVVDVTPYLVTITPTTAQSMIATLVIRSSDLVGATSGAGSGLPNFEVFAPPIQGATTAITSYADPLPRATYKMMLPTNGGENLIVQGLNQVGPTSQPFMGAELTLTNTPLPEPVYGAKVGGGDGSALSTTTVGTTANTNVVGVNISLTGLPARIKSLFGILAQRTVTTVRASSGYFLLSESALEISPLRYAAEPVQGNLTTADTAFAHLTRSDGRDIGVNVPATIVGSFQAGNVSPATAALFAQGILYRYG